MQGCQNKTQWLYASTICKLHIASLALHYSRMWFYALCYPHIAANYGAVAYGYTTKYCCARIYHHIVFYNRVASYSFYGVAVVVGWEAFCAECYALIYFYMFAYNASLANYYACAVVDGEIFADTSSWVYVDACVGMCQFADYAWYYRHTKLQ